MDPYILGKRGLVHIIDLKQTLKGLLQARKFIARVVGSGSEVLFVGTKRQAREIVKAQAARCEMPYVSERWLGGTLTNFRTIRSRLARLEELEALDESGAMSGYSKKMESSLKRERRKIRRNLEGIRQMSHLPGGIVLVDVRREHIAVREAKKLDIPTICLLDTDGDPDLVDLPIPGNDDAMRSIEVIISQLADAVLEGKAAREEAPAETEKSARPARRRSSRAAARAQDKPAAETAEPAPTPAPEAPDDGAASSPDGTADTQKDAVEETAAAAGPDEAPSPETKDDGALDQPTQPDTETERTTP